MFTRGISSPPNREGSLGNKRKRWLSSHFCGAYKLGLYECKQEGTNRPVFSYPKFPILALFMLSRVTEKAVFQTVMKLVSSWVVSGHISGVHKHHTGLSLADHWWPWAWWWLKHSLIHPKAPCEKSYGSDLLRQWLGRGWPRVDRRGSISPSGGDALNS